MKLPVEKTAHLVRNDPVSIWESYRQAFGNPARVAAHHGITLVEVLELANVGQWARRLAEEGGLGKEDRDVVTTNRGVNLVHARRLSAILSRVMDEIESVDGALEEFTSEPTKTGMKRTVKPLVDLAKALATAQDMTYRALGDSGGTKDAPPADVDALAAAVKQTFALTDKAHVPVIPPKTGDA
jgi:hypothetical protein